MILQSKKLDLKTIGDGLLTNVVAERSSQISA